MPSDRAVIVTFIILAIVVAGVLASFVFPGYLTTNQCTSNFRGFNGSNSRAYCSDAVLVPSPLTSSGRCVNGYDNGTPVNVDFAGVSFSLHSGGVCVGFSNCFLSVAVDECQVQIRPPSAFADGELVNWTIPDGLAGIQWSIATGILSAPQPVALLVAA